MAAVAGPGKLHRRAAPPWVQRTTLAMCLADLREKDLARREGRLEQSAEEAELNYQEEVGAAVLHAETPSTNLHQSEL